MNTICPKYKKNKLQFLFYFYTIFLCGAFFSLFTFFMGSDPYLASAQEMTTGDVSILPFQDIKRNMKGTTVTVFEGQKKEEFQVDILGAFQTSVEQRMILGRFSGEHIEQTGIAQGMSGSPVYVDGKLIGAIAFTWPYLEEILAGIQPIEDMISIFHTEENLDESSQDGLEEDEVNSDSDSALGAWVGGVPSYKSPIVQEPEATEESTPSLDSEESSAWVDGNIFQLWDKINQQRQQYYASMQSLYSEKVAKSSKNKVSPQVSKPKIPFPTRVQYKGLSASRVKNLTHFWIHSPIDLVEDSLGWNMSLDPSEVKSPEDGLEPGDPVAIVLLRGDAEISAIGTVTYQNPLNKNELLIFGHPFQSLGNIDLPIAQAYVHYTIPSQELSWKLSSPTHLVGRTMRDTQWGVSVLLGDIPSMIPVQITDGAKKKDYHYEVVSNPELFSNIFFTLLGSFLDSRGSQNPYYTFDIQYDITLQDKAKEEEYHITWDDTILSHEKENYLFGDIENVFMALQKNIYGKSEIKDIKISFHSETYWKVKKIVSAKKLPRATQPHMVDIELEMQSYGGKLYHQVFSIRLPEQIQESQFILQIAPQYMQSEEKKELYPNIQEVKTYDQLVEYLQKRNSPYNDIVFYADLDGITSNIDGYELADIPLSQALNMAKENLAHSIYGKYRKVWQFDTPDIIIGGAYVFIDMNEIQYQEVEAREVGGQGLSQQSLERKIN